jgi:hypothetical protein
VKWQAALEVDDDLVEGRDELETRARTVFLTIRETGRAGCKGSTLSADEPPVTPFKDAAEALRRMEAFQLDAIILDLIQPRAIRD